jgi:hypothetical protein
VEARDWTAGISRAESATDVMELFLTDCFDGARHCDQDHSNRPGEAISAPDLHFWQPRRFGIHSADATWSRPLRCGDADVGRAPDRDRICRGVALSFADVGALGLAIL